MYLLDTCVISDFVKGDPSTLQILKSHSPSDLFVSTITLMEIEYGLLRIPERRHTLDPIIKSLLGCMGVLVFCEHSAQIAAEIRHSLSKQGKPIVIPQIVNRHDPISS